MNALPMNQVVFDAVIVEEDYRFTFIQLCQACHTSDSQLRSLVDEGILHPQGSGPGDWVFDGQAMRTARMALRLTRELQFGLEAAALVLDLLAQNEALRARLRREGRV